MDVNGEGGLIEHVQIAAVGREGHVSDERPLEVGGGGLRG